GLRRADTDLRCEPYPHGLCPSPPDAARVHPVERAIRHWYVSVAPLRTARGAVKPRIMARSGRCWRVARRFGLVALGTAAASAIIGDDQPRSQAVCGSLSGARRRWLLGEEGERAGGPDSSSGEREAEGEAVEQVSAHRPRSP